MPSESSLLFCSPQTTSYQGLPVRSLIDSSRSFRLAEQGFVKFPNWLARLFRGESKMLTAGEVVDTYFLEVRCALLELAATLDRYDRDCRGRIG